MNILTIITLLQEEPQVLAAIITILQAIQKIQSQGKTVTP